MNRTSELPPECYIREKQTKDAIVIHHTSGGSVQSTIDWWRMTPERIATTFIIDRNGTICELFDPSFWAYHTGIPGNNGALDRRSIGIEIVSEGGLIEHGGKFYSFDKISDATEYTGPVYDHTHYWRGQYQYFARYSDKQVDSVIMLVDYLCDRFNIPRRTPSDHYSFNPKLYSFPGILGHHHIRPDKTDPHPGFDWKTLIIKCRLEAI